VNARSFQASSRHSATPYSRRNALRFAGQGAIAASLMTWLGPEVVGVAQQAEPP
jgi:hypothetical protein